MRQPIKLLFFLFSIISPNTFAFENLVYTWRGFPTQITEGDIALNDLKQHAALIDILSSQAYHIDEKGVLYGSVNPEMTKIAREHHIKLLPLVGNGNFDRAKVHTFLHDPDAQDRAIQSIIKLCQENNYPGVQIDFESMSFLDRDAFSQFYKKLAEAMHQNKLVISAAVIPTLTEQSPSSAYLKGRYEGYTGAYDYKVLGENSDFITLMGYDQHGAITTPGPMAGITWDEDLIKVALKYIPSEKISLGIPWHSGYWYTGKDPQPESGQTLTNPLHAVQTNLSYAATTRLLQDHNASLRWDDLDKMHYTFYTNNFLYEYIFVEDADSFAAKLDLVKKYKLRGTSAWCLGEEDPKVWDILAKRFGH